MTGFGAAERGGIRVEIRSLNHRFMEAYVKTSSALSAHEMSLREILKSKFNRGKFDAYVTITSDSAVSMNINKKAAKGIKESLDSLVGELGLSGGVDMGLLLNWKDMFMSEEVGFDPADLIAAFHEASDALLAMRQKEGKATLGDINSRIDNIEALNSEIERICPDLESDCKTKYYDRLKELLREAEIDEGRIMQEAAQIVEKGDISEEVQRIKSHIEQIRKTLASGDTVGRKFDFLLQELHRESNTIASKATGTKILNNVIEIKSEIEKLREQAQNIQ